MQKLRIIVGGYIGLYPTGGAAWDYIQYPLGLIMLGHDVYYIEDTMQYPVYQLNGKEWNDASGSIEYLNNTMKTFGMEQRWAYRDIATGECYGLSLKKVLEICKTADGILNWTEKNNIPLRGHNLFWGISKFVQPWVKELDDSALRQTLEHRAETITKRYKGRFAEYDLNNEMIHGNYYEDRLGPEITKLMTEWAHQGDPDAKLFLNDYDILTGNKLPDYMAQIRKLLSQDVPIAGIGVQGHLHTDTFDRHQLKNALDSLAIFKLPIRITEFNMPGQRSKYHRENIREMTPQEEELKAKEMIDYYKICFAHPAVEGILMWGFWAGANWIPVSSLYKLDWSPTPAAEAYQNLIFKEWWTKASQTTGKDGILTIPAFYGKYKITIKGNSKEIDLNKKEEKVIVDFRN